MRNFIDIVTEAQKYPARASNADLVAMNRDGDHENYHAGDENEYYAGRGATLTMLPVASLQYGNDVDPDVVDIYSNLSTPAPPIIVDGDQVENGNHRLAAARARGEEMISAYLLD